MYSLCCHAYRDALSLGAECAAIPNRYGGVALIPPQPFCPIALPKSWEGPGEEEVMMGLSWIVSVCVYRLWP